MNGGSEHRQPMATLPNNARWTPSCPNRGSQDRDPDSTEQGRHPGLSSYVVSRQSPYKPNYGSNTTTWNADNRSAWNSLPRDSTSVKANPTPQDTETPYGMNGIFSPTSFPPVVPQQSTPELTGNPGLGSLVASSEYDQSWTSQPSGWNGVNGCSIQPQSRSPGVSPAPKSHQDQGQSLSSYMRGLGQNTPACLSTGRASNQRQTIPGKSTSTSLLDRNPTNLSDQIRQISLINAHGMASHHTDSDSAHFQAAEATAGRLDQDNTPFLPRGRRSVFQEYITPQGNAARRNGAPSSSLQSGGPPQYDPLPTTIGLYTSISASAHLPGPISSTASHAHDRQLQERNGFTSKDTVSQFRRSSMNDAGEPTATSHRPSMSINNSTQKPFQDTELVHEAQNTVQADFFALPSYNPHYQTNADEQLASSHRIRLESLGGVTPNGLETAQKNSHYRVNTDARYAYRCPSREEVELRALPNEAATASNGFCSAPVNRQGVSYSLGHSPWLPGHHSRVSYQLAGISSLFALQHTPDMRVFTPPPRAPREHDSSHNIRSALLEQFKATQRIRRWELREVYGHFVEFAGDQDGSRFIQNKLEIAHSDDKERVFKELEPNALQLMQDVFGNYVIQKFFEHGDQNQKKILANCMKGHVFSLSTGVYGCRVVQKALETILVDQQAALVKELERDVMKCVKDQNGNHVIQKAVERVPPAHIQFIIEAFRGQVGSLASHCYGCRVIQRMLEYCEDSARSSILEELHNQGPNLITDQYGNYVAQHIIERGSPEDRERIMSHVMRQLLFFSKHKFASNVVEKCLMHGTAEQRRQIMAHLIGEEPLAETNKDTGSVDKQKSLHGESKLAILLRDAFGNYVIQKLLDTLEDQDYAALVTRLKPEVDRGRRNGAGKQFNAVEKKMHRLAMKNTSPEVANRNIATTAADRKVEPPVTTPPLTMGTRSGRSSLDATANATPDETPEYSNNPKI